MVKFVNNTRKPRSGRAERRATSKKVEKRVIKIREIPKLKSVRPVRSGVPRQMVEPARDDRSFVNWLAAAKRDPWNVKPPSLGIHSESTMVVQLRWREAMVLPNSVIRCVVRPYAQNFFGYTADADGSATAVIWRSSATLSALNGMFNTGRPLAGGLKLIPTFAATLAPGYFTSMQQATVAAGGWQNVAGNTFGSTADLLTASQTSPVATVAGVPLVQVWHDEDLADTMMNGNVTRAGIANTFCELPQVVATMALVPTNTVVYVDAIMWVECALRDDVASVFGGNSRQNRVVNPERILEAESKAPDAPQAMAYVASAGTGLAAACMQSSACSTIVGTGMRMASERFFSRT